MQCNKGIPGRDREKKVFFLVPTVKSVLQDMTSELMVAGSFFSVNPNI